jgi:hypothetical protein
MNKVNHRREFFRVDLGHIRDEVEKLGLEAKWTLTAAALLLMEIKRSVIIASRW